MTIKTRRAYAALVLLLLSASLPLHANVAAEWNGALLAAVRPQTPAPLLLVRNLAILHRCLHDAISLVHPEGQAAAFLPVAFDDGRADQIPPELAAAFAGHSVSVALFPSAKPLFDRLLEDQTAGVSEKAKRAARIVGLQCARAHIEDRRNDGISSTITYRPRSEPGQWRRTPPNFRPPELPHGRYVRPFVIGDPDSFLPPGPPSLDSEAWSAGFHQVRSIGARNSSERTDEQSVIARFWSDFSYTITPPGHWNQIACAIAAKRDFSLQKEAHLLAWLNTTLLDAGIVCWEAKYRFNFWRPLTAIYEADRDGREDTQPDFRWNSYLQNPPHPEYPSGHSSFSGAAARFLQLYLGTDAVSFSATSDTVPGHTREFDSLWDCAEEISWSRIYGGIHYLFSGDDGLETGKRVAEAVFKASP